MSENDQLMVFLKSLLKLASVLALLVLVVVKIKNVNNEIDLSDWLILGVGFVVVTFFGALLSGMLSRKTRISENTAEWLVIIVLMGALIAFYYFIFGIVI